MNRLSIICILYSCALTELYGGIRLTKKRLNTFNNLNTLANLSGLISSNLTSVSYSSQVVDKNKSTSGVEDSFLIDISPTQNTKSKLYTIKKTTNRTVNGSITFKYKRNSTERSVDVRQLDSESFKSFDCDLCNSDLNCANNQTCHLYFTCPNSTLFSQKSNDFNQSNAHRSLNSPHDSNSFLIEKRHYCDGLCDCLGCEDEINCSLNKCDKSNEIMCQDKSSCIMPQEICDSIFNCRDHSDEIECFDSRGCVLSGRFSCDNQCLERALVCDGLQDDCSDKSDEDCECTENEFRCFNGQCIKKSQRCNGVEFECSDGSDEFQCVLIDERDIVLKILPDLNHGVLCAESNFSIQEADEICRLVGKESADEFSQVEIELENSTQWLSKLSFWDWSKNVRLNDLNKTSLPIDTNQTNRRFTCKDNLAQTVTCKKFNCSSINHDFNNSFNQSNHRHIGTPREIESMIHLQANYFDLINNTTQSIECFAQIISPIWLLSSFNCLNSFSSNNIKLDTIDLNHRQNLTSRIKRIILHPHSTIYRSMFIRNFDLGLIQLDRPIIFEDKGVNAICLPIRDIDVDITCFLTNFNDTEPLPFLVVDRDRCNEFNHFNNTVARDNICTIKQRDHDEERGNFVQNGTSIYRSIRNSNGLLPTGSPLICLNSDSKWFLAGFLNYFDDRNNLEHPTVFSNVFRMLDFISRVTGLDQS